MNTKNNLIALAVALCFSTSQTFAAPPLSAHQTYYMSDSKEAAQLNAWVEIDKAAFEGNIQALKQHLNGKSNICAVMKADAYGHGIALLMPSVIKMGVNCIGVANNNEAKVVRDSGFKGRLMRVRTGSLNEVAGAVQYKMEELVGNADFAQAVAKIAKSHQTTIHVHVALNSSGMSRNGLEMSTEQGRLQALEIVKISGLKTVGIMTHFAVEDRDDVLKGLATFNAESAWLMTQGKLKREKITLHAANSFATLEVPESHLDMVRPGGALYGDTVPSFTQYKRIESFKSKVATVNSYPAGNTVGYDRTFTLKHDSLLANIPVGYSDGYRRVFTNKGTVLIQGNRVPVVGKVSMNTLMVDVTDVPNIKAGDEVVLFGRQGDAEITQSEIEEINGALLADLYTVWGNSNPKVIKK